MFHRVILSCAVTGNITSAQHPGLPVTPAEIAASAIEAAGAAIAHIHVRDPNTAAPSMELAHYADVATRVRAARPELIINLTTGPGGRYLPSDDDPARAAADTTLTTPARRVAHVVALKPDICSLDLNTMYSGASVVINTPRNVAKMAELIRGAGVKPELEVFDSGDIHLARALIANGVIATPALFQIVLGVRYGAAATPDAMRYMRAILPGDAQWAAFGIGRWEFPMLAQAYLLGGHVRVGLEDNIYLEKGVLAPTNAALVDKAVRILRLLGGEVATPTQSREMLGLPPARV